MACGRYSSGGNGSGFVPTKEPAPVEIQKTVVHRVIVNKTVTETVPTAVEVYLSECDDYITMMVGGMSAVSISKKTLKLVVNDMEYEKDYDYEHSDHEFNNTTKW
jgi:hypothetical protein